MSVLDDVRDKISKLGKSELETKESIPVLQELWDQMQDLRNEMNAAKKAAAEEASKPYQEAIQEIEKRYAFMLRIMN